MGIRGAHLLCKLAGGCKHDDPGQAASLAAVHRVVCQQPLHNGQHKCQRLALSSSAAVKGLSMFLASQVAMAWRAKDAGQQPPHNRQHRGQCFALSSAAALEGGEDT